MHEQGSEVGIVVLPSLDGIGFSIRIAEEPGGNGIQHGLHEVLHIQGPLGAAVEAGVEPERQGDGVLIPGIPGNGAPGFLDRLSNVDLQSRFLTALLVNSLTISPRTSRARGSRAGESKATAGTSQPLIFRVW